MRLGGTLARGGVPLGYARDRAPARCLRIDRRMPLREGA